MGFYVGPCVCIHRFVDCLLISTRYFFDFLANLAAVLTVSRPHIPIRSLDDLANQSDISYGTIRDGSTMQFFQVLQY